MQSKKERVSRLRGEIYADVDAVVVVAFDGMIICGMLITNHVPNLFWPFVSPAFLSPAKKYSGHPSYVSCFVPSVLEIEPNADALTPRGSARLETVP
jgi:hypothetical protein